MRLRSLLAPLIVTLALLGATLLPLRAAPIAQHYQPLALGAYLPAVFKGGTVVPTQTPTVPPPAAPPPPTSTPDPRPSLFITSSSGRYRSTSYSVSGELLNTGTNTAYDAQVTATFYSGNTIVGSAQGDALLTRIDGGIRVPFKLTQFNAPANITSYGLFVEWKPKTTLSWRSIAVLSANVRDDFGPEIYGSIKNAQDVAVRNIRVAVTFYDASGKVVWVEDGATLLDLDPGEVGTYEVYTGDDEFEYSTYLVQAEGYT